MSSPLATSWSTAQIGNLCELKNGRAFKPSDWSQHGLPIVRIQNLNNPHSSFNHYDGEYDDKHFLAGGELLFAWSGTPGTSFGAHVWRGGNALLNQHIFRVDFDERLLDKRFFRHAINQKLNELINVAHGGAGLQHVTKGVFEATEVVIPPRAEQQRIADKLDTVLARVDAVDDRLARVATLLKRFRQAVLAAATSGRLTADWRAGRTMQPVELVRKKGALAVDPDGSNEEWLFQLPSSWLAHRAADVVDEGSEIVYGIVQPGPRLDIGVPYVRGMDIVDGRIQVGQLLRTSQSIAAKYERASLRGGDVLLGIIRATKVAIVPDELSGANITQGTARFRPSKVVSSKFLAFVLECPQTQAWLHAHYRGIDMPGLNLADVRRTPIPLPPASEQAEIVRRVDILLAFAGRLEAKLQAAQTASARLTPALLAKAFRGELVPQDPADEPAVELLKRLAAGRAEATKPKRSRGAVRAAAR